MKSILMICVGLMCISVHATPMIKKPEMNIPEVGTGSGFFVTQSGYIITNFHVVEYGREFAVMTTNGVTEAKLVKCDPATDLALLKVEGKFEACSLASRRTEKLGAEVFTMGFPQPDIQGFSPKVTKGVVSGTDGVRDNVQHYQIDASIQPGNSGGPLFDANGNVVGVMVATLKDSQVVSYAIKKAYLRAFLDSVNVCFNEIKVSEDRPAGRLSDVVDRVRPSCVLVLSYNCGR